MKRLFVCLVLWLAGQLPFAAAQFCPKDAASIKKFVVEVEKLGGKAEFDPNSPGDVIRLSLAKLGANDADLKIVLNLTKLRVLDLRGSSLKGPGLAYLKNLKELQELDLSFTWVEDDGLAHLQALPNLKKLNLSQSCKIGGKITDKGVAYLKALPKLEWLDLNSNHLTDKGLVHLKSMKSLTYLVVGVQSSVTVEGKNDLRKALPTTKVDD